MNLAGKVAVVTGASRGIGKAIALELAREGADIAVVARTEAPGGPFPGTIHETADAVRALGRRALAVKTNLAKEESISDMAACVLSEWGRIDILVNNAGVNVRAPLLELTTKQWDLVMNVDLRGVFLCSKAVLPGMISRKSGSIINITSLAGLAFDPAFQSTVENSSPVYAAAKAAANMLTVTLAREVAQHRVAVNAFLPNWTASETVLAWYKGRPDAPAESEMQTPRMWGRYAAALCSPESKFITERLFTQEDLEKEFGKV